MTDRHQIAALGSLLPDQPPPTPGTGDMWRELIDAAGPAHPRLVPMMEERRQLGIERYGQPLQRGDGRDHLSDAKQELLDAAVYLWAAGREGNAMLVLGVLEGL